MFKAKSCSIFMSLILFSILFILVPITSAPVIGLPSAMAVSPLAEWDYHNGNWEYVNRTRFGFPVNITHNHIPIGQNWTYVFNLRNDSQYHVYFYGKWIGTKTDYDVFVYDPNGIQETYHTESYGLPEHLGTNVTYPFFTPKKNGNYSILLVNDGVESKGAETGTLMVIEHLDVNKWYRNKLYMEGKDPLTNKPRYNSTYVYEFNSSKRNIEITIDVPNSLDMYEVRLYPMATPSLGSVLNSMPIAWELGLYNESTQVVGTYPVGGYNINFSGYRGPVEDAYMLHKGTSFDSCEQPGEDMFINYTSPYSGNVLYHLVFLAEWNNPANSMTGGFLSFIIKTDFTEPYLSVSKPDVIYARKEVTITAISNDTESGIQSVNMSYSIDNGISWNSTGMTRSQSQVYTAIIPGQLAGTKVLYKVEAQDYARNKAKEEGSYQTKSLSSVTCTTSSSSLRIGERVIISGAINTSISVKVTLNISGDGGVSWSNLTALTTASNGTYSYAWIPSSVGSYQFKASWFGDSMYLKATSDAASVSVSKAISSILCSLSNSSITYGSSATVSGKLTDALTGGGLLKRTVHLKYSTDGGTWNNITDVLTGAEGAYSYVWSPNAGSFMIRAVWDGNNTYEGSVSSTVSLSAVMITCSLSKETTTIGGELIVSGSIIPTISGKNVTLTYKKPDGATLNRTVITVSDSSYSDSYLPDAIGSWSVTVCWRGDENYKEATSPTKSFTITKISSTISCSVSQSAITEGESITISGSISPVVSGKSVTLAYKRSDGTTVTRTTTTGSDGSYSDSYKPDATGSWSVTASWDGDPTHESASNSKSFTVNKKSGCFIATATYGSELSPEVQFLREFRDDIVLKTSMGSLFMSVFNNIYYSFSPTVASVISSSEVFRGLMKMILYPLMSILHLGVETYSLFSFNPDLGIVLFCLVVSSLMSIIYLVPWALLFSFLKKTTISIKKIRTVGLTWAGSIALILFAEVTGSTLLMMASGGLFVLVTACLATLTTVRVVTKHYSSHFVSMNRNKHSQ